MITEAQIISINLQDNTCEVDMPLFRTANTPQPITATAYFSCLPGIYGGYAPGDVVWIAFENGLMDKPVVIGKIYKGPDAESARGGAIVADDVKLKKSAELPKNSAIKNVDADYNTIDKLIAKIRALESKTQSSYEMRILGYDSASNPCEIAFHSVYRYDENTIGKLAANLNKAGFKSADAALRVIDKYDNCTGIYSADGVSVYGAVGGGRTWKIYEQSEPMTATLTCTDVSGV